jgi:hypothetical protein
LRQYGIEGEIVSRYGAQGSGPSVYITDPEGTMLELKGPPSSGAQMSEEGQQ